MSNGPIEAAREWMNRVGPANCWTGTHAESARPVSNAEIHGVATVDVDLKTMPERRSGRTHCYQG